MGDVPVVVVVVGEVEVGGELAVGLPRKRRVDRIEVVLDVVVIVVLPLDRAADAVGQGIADRAGGVGADREGALGILARIPGAEPGGHAGALAVEVGLLRDVVDVAAAAGDRAEDHRRRARDDVGAFVGVEVGGVAHRIAALAVLEDLGALAAQLRRDAGVLPAAAGDARGVLGEVVGAEDDVLGQLFGIDLGDRARGVEDRFLGTVDRGRLAHRDDRAVLLDPLAVDDDVRSAGRVLGGGVRLGLVRGERQAGKGKGPGADAQKERCGLHVVAPVAGRKLPPGRMTMLSASKQALCHAGLSLFYRSLSVVMGQSGCGVRNRPGGIAARARQQKTPAHLGVRGRQWTSPKRGRAGSDQNLARSEKP